MKAQIHALYALFLVYLVMIMDAQPVNLLILWTLIVKVIVSHVLLKIVLVVIQPKHHNALHVKVATQLLMGLVSILVKIQTV